MKKRFIFDENYIKKYAKKGRLKWLIIGLSGLVLIVVIIIVVLATRNNRPTPNDPATPRFTVKEELTIESGSPVPSVEDYFDELENIDLNSIIVTYPDEFELSYDTSSCTVEEEEEIYSTDEPNYSDFDCVQNLLITPATYGVTLEVQGEEFNVTLNVEDTAAPVIITQNIEIYEGDNYELEDFVNICFDVTSECNLSYYMEDTDEEGNPIDYSNITEVGEHTIRMIATDDYDNISEPVSATLTILEAEGTLYTVSFNSNGGSEINSRRVSENGKVIEPAAPTRDGYIFLGWYLNDEEFDFNSNITSNITLTARWERISESGGEGSGGNSGSGSGSGSGGGSQVVYVSSISLNYSQIGMSVGQTRTVTATVYPSNAVNGAVTWSSSDSSIATVSNGNITAVNPGTATITATAGGKSATVRVIVAGGTTTTCTYGNTSYNPNYILSVNLTENGCAISPDRTPNETASLTDYNNLINDLTSMGIRVSGNVEHRVVETLKVKNTSGTGLVGYQITILVNVVDSDNPYMIMSARYILNSDGSRHFLSNNICKNNVCLSP